MNLPLDLLWLALAAYAVVQALVLAATSGRERLAAAAPLAVMIPLAAVAAINFARGGNLWPLPTLLASPFALGYVAVAALRIARGRKIAPR